MGVLSHPRLVFFITYRQFGKSKFNYINKHSCYTASGTIFVGYKVKDTRDTQSCYFDK